MSNIIFTAHDAGIGDCFSIQDNGKLYVIDGGNGKRIVDDFVGRTIDVCIVTHNDRDHTFGVKHLLDKGVDIKEIWLPGIWQPILNHIKCNPKILIDLEEFEVSTSDNDEIKPTDLTEGTDAEMGTLYDVEDSNLQYVELFEWHTKLMESDPKRYFNSINIKLNRILDLFSQAIERGCLIKFFFPEESKIEDSINGNDPFKMLNSTLLVKLKKVKDETKRNFVQLISLSATNKYSLVFEYLFDKQSIILFTGDSNLFFIANNSTLKYDSSEIIVTAPHHGSESNKVAYSKIIGKKILWVKSGGSMKCLTGNTFKNATHYQKYCNRCITLNHYNFRYKKISFEFQNNSWISLENNHCICCKCNKCWKRTIKEKLDKVNEQSSF